MSLKDVEIKLEAIKLQEEGLGPVAIGRLLGIPHQTVSDFLNEETYTTWWQEYKRNRPVVVTNVSISEDDYILTARGNFAPKNFSYNEDEHCWNLGERILVISDTHFPYHHPDTFDFLEHLAEKHKVTGVVSVGDMNDNHYPSFHEKEYDCYSGREELEHSKEACQRLESLFPRMLISEGNHDILPKRKAKSADIPLDWVAHPNHIYGLGGEWQWDSHHYFYTGDSKCLLVHTIGANTRTNAEKYSHNSAQGHHHSEFSVAYSADTDKLKWSMSVGCLIDPKAPAFRYDKKVITKRPILGGGVIIDNTPYTEPMVLKTNGRWRGY